MFGNGGGWGIPIAATSLALTVSGIEQMFKCIDSQFRVREMLSLTLSFDHDVIDGALAARFAARMKALIEAAHGLDHLNTLQANSTPASITG